MRFAKLVVPSAILILLAICPITVPTPMPQPTATWTPLPPVPTPTPVVIVVTATPAPTSAPTAVDVADFCEVPPIEFFALGLLNVHGKDIKVVPQFGVPCEGGIIAVPFEKPRDSGKWHVAVFGAEGGRWPLLDTIAVDSTPTPSFAPTPGAGREARIGISWQR